MLNRVIQQFGLQLITINEVEDSFSSTVYKCTLTNNENVYLKIPFSRLKYQRELEAYEILKGRVSIPIMLDYWSGDAECAGALHAEMHLTHPPANKVLTGIKNEFTNWSDFVEKQFYSFAEDVEDILDEKLYKKSIETFEKMKKQLPSPDGPSFVHMDFRPANIIVDNDKVLGIIDFESVRFGSTEIDFSKLYRDFLSIDVKLYDAYQEGYNSIRPLIDLENVLPFYRFTDAFNSIGWCKRRGIEKNALFLGENLARLKNWLL